jgi:hypothetical protein
MTSMPRSYPDGSVSGYLVERYVRPSDVPHLPDFVALVARLCADRGHARLGVTYLHSAYLPAEDTCFCLFRAPSSDAVRAVNREARFPLDRITDAVLLPTDFLAPKETLS